MKLTVYIMVFYFSLGACIPKCDFSQLAKLNNLMDHYELHQKEAMIFGKTIGFSEFLYQHFFNSEHHQHDSDTNHDNLPFQNLTTNVFCIPTAQPLKTVSRQIIRRAIPTFDNLYVKSITFDIFHPPRLA